MPALNPTTTQRIIDRAAAELVEELLESASLNISKPWFATINRKMKRLVKDLEEEKVIRWLR